MNPEMREKPNTTMAITRPKNQSAFQKAVFMNSPLGALPIPQS